MDGGRASGRRPVPAPDRRGAEHRSPAIEGTGISRSFGGVRALQEASFGARPGEIHALVGENGAGKSTLIKILCGVLRPDGGSVRIRGRRRRLPQSAPARALGVGTVFQELSLHAG